MYISTVSSSIAGSFSTSILLLHTTLSSVPRYRTALSSFYNSPKILLTFFPIILDLLVFKNNFIGNLQHAPFISSSIFFMELVSNVTL